MKKIEKQEALSFDGLGIAPKLLEILTELKFVTPSPIQHQSIPVSLEGKDMVGIAQTGTGKTLAFGIPMLQLLAAHGGKGLVVLPTRELALQVDESLKVIGKKIGLRTAVLIGGEPINKQLRVLKNKPHIIVATPGRLMDHAERRSVDLGQVKILVLDEADMMLDMGFLPQIKSILKLVPKKRQTMLFSATMPTQIVKIASDYMSLPTRIEVAPAGTSSENVEQQIMVVGQRDKFDELKKILAESKGSVLIFMRTKYAVKTLTKKVNQLGFTAAEIHSNRSLGQRKNALEGFKLGRFKILIATDIAARGIDVKEIGLVINYDLPEKTGDYVHRIGRTGRAGKSGKAISFVMPSQIKTLREIEKLINKTLEINKTPEELKILRRNAVDEKPKRRPKSRFPQRGGVGKREYNKTTSDRNTGYSKKFKPTTKPVKKKKTSNKTFETTTKPTFNTPGPRMLTDKEKFRRSMMTGRR